VTLTVFDILGREVATLVNAQQSAASYTVEFDASNLSSGIYFYQLKVNDYTNLKKMVILK
jgi:endo-1,4-beta-xylanase